MRANPWQERVHPLPVGTQSLIHLVDMRTKRAPAVHFRHRAVCLVKISQEGDCLGRSKGADPDLFRGLEGSSRHTYRVPNTAGRS